MSETTAVESVQKALTTPEHPLLLFFDGDCSFCTRWVAKVIKADAKHRARFATIQGPTYRRMLQVFPRAGKVESVVLVQRQPDGKEDFFLRSTAIRKLIDGLPGFRFFAFVLHMVPTPLSNLGYIIVAKLREPLFSRWAACRPAVEQNREVFLD
jgi:predicted DCC family thiol-disulfide oxidoreductase YuxK